VCAVCPDGGDVIKLVMKVENLSFRAALEWLGRPRHSDPASAARRERERAERRALRECDAQFYRNRERRKLYDIWHHALAPAGTVVEAYAERRRLKLPPFAHKCLRCVPRCSTSLMTERTPRSSIVGP
jgi:DNA primase